ncbi:MAG: hypothetical protein ABIH21_03705 [Patescibacteria group bacterium]
MILTKKESKLFFDLYIPLLGYANNYDGKNKQKTMAEARDILYSNKQIIEDFIKDNSKKFNKEKLNIIKGWKTFIKDDFVLIRSLKKYSVLLTIKGRKARAYGILGITEPVVDVALYGIGTYLENIILLPWKDKIIWDGLCIQKPIILGNNYMKSFTREYMQIKKAGNIIEKLN